MHDSIRNILLVDDDKRYREILKDKLKIEGYNVIVADNGKNALASVIKDPVDLIILDLMMPEMDGVNFFYHLKETVNRDIPVVILTNLSVSTYPEEVHDFIVKLDIDLDDIILKIKSYSSRN